MEITVRLLIDATERVERTVANITGAMTQAPATAVRPVVTGKQKAPAATPAAIGTPAPVPAEKTVRESAPAQVEAPAPKAEAPAPAPEYDEKPEDVLPLLRERFAIPAAKEDRTPDEQERAKALNKAVIAVIREVTKNNRNKSIADLRTEDDRKRFIELALQISYDANNGTFNVMPF